MICEIGSFKFNGFYESCFSNSDDYYDECYNVYDELSRELGVSDFEVDIEYNDEYERDVCKQFMKEYVNQIKEVLPYWITENKMFKFDIVDDKDNIVIVSPKYYNFETDKYYCNIETNIETLNLIKWYTLNLKGAKEYIIKRHSSYDGFISFIRNDINYWKRMSMSEMIYEERYLIALLDMLLLLLDNENIFELINYDVLEKVEKYEYMKEPTIYYNKKYYELDEFKKLMSVEV